MNKLSNNIKFYNFIKVLRQYSDENNILSISDTNKYLKDLMGETLDRRTIYGYVSDLKTLGFEISAYEENHKGYYLEEHGLEDYELRLLIDSVSSSKFITKKKTKELIRKLLNFNNIYFRHKLENKMFIDNRAKAINEEIYYNIDKLNTALKDKKKISFNYYDYNEKRKLEARKEKGHIKEYIANPIGMLIKEEQYYLILNNDKYDDISNYRIDRMKNIIVLDEKRKALSKIQGCGSSFNIGKYSKMSFKMFKGIDTEIVLIINGNLLNTIIDELGEDVNIEKLSEKKYEVKFDAKLGTGLATWILQLGSDAVVISPESLKKTVLEELEKIKLNYY